MKREWGASNPFDFPPNEFHQGVLKAVEPFLRIHQRPISALNVSDDRFKGNNMPRAALDACLDFIAFHLAEKERSFSEQHSEGNLRPLHIEMIRMVESFTTPTEMEFQLLQGDFVPVCSDGEDQAGFDLVDGGKDKASEQADLEEGVEDAEQVQEQVQDLPVAPRTPRIPDSQGFKMGSESPPQGQSDVSGRGRTDCRVFVHDLSPLKRPDLSDLIKCELSTQRCALVAEFKSVEDDEAIYQAAAYAREEILRNISNKHYKPIFLLVFSKAKFTYGFIRYEGRMRASGNAITEAAYADFYASCKDPTKCTDLATKFKASTDYLRTVYKSGVRCSKRSYIVGDLYMAQQWFPLPTTTTTGGMVSYGTYKLYEGLLLTLVGDVVRTWTDMDALNAYTRRTLQSYAAISIGGRSIRNLIMRQQYSLMMGAGVHGLRSMGDPRSAQALLEGPRDVKRRKTE